MYVLSRQGERLPRGYLIFANVGPFGGIGTQALALKLTKVQNEAIECKYLNLSHY